MRDKWICHILMILVLPLLFQTAGAMPFEDDIRDKIIALYNLDTVTTQIEIRRNPMQMETQEYDSIRINPMTKAEPVGIVAIQVELFQNDKIINSGQLRINIARYENVLVVAEPIKRNGIISPEKINITRMETTSLSDRPLTLEKELVGKWAKRSINKGQIITAGMVEKIPPIISGKEVSILYKSSWLEITTPGKSMEPGYVGETIRIKNEETGKIIKGTVIDDKTVLISNL
jgi:flagella basal body P-ring formation protein FlgA